MVIFMKLSLIIPCYNESENLPLCLKRCSELIDKDIEVILVDNGSTDSTPSVLLDLLPKYPGCRSIRVDRNEGYGAGILAGLKESTGDVIGWTHADMQTDPCDVVRGFELFKEYGSNIFVKGYRYGRPLMDVFFTIGMSVFESILLRKILFDINAQPTLFSRNFFDSWSDPPKDFSLDLFAYYSAKLSKIRIYKFPVKFGDRAFGVSHWNVDWKSKKKFIYRTIEYSLKLRRILK